MRTWMLALLALLCASSISPAQARISAEDVQAIEAASPERARVLPARPRLLLVFNRCEGFRHSAVPYGAAALQALGRKTGAFSLEESEAMESFRPENLARFDAVCFNNSTGLRFDDPALRKSLLDFVRGGGGLVGIHGATDNFPTWPEGAALIGGLFDGHPWEAGGSWGLRVEEPGHPLVAAFSSPTFRISDEIYRIRPLRLREECRVLLSLDLCDTDNFSAKGIRSNDFDIPVSWIKTVDKGRLFYCSLGHNHAIFSHRQVLQHYLDGIQFALGDLPAPAEPRPFDPLLAAPSESLDRIAGEAAGYVYGGCRLRLTQLAHLARLSLSSAPARTAVEGIFLRRIQGGATPDAIKFFAEQLGIIGSEASLPGLLALSARPGMADIARYALERIPGSRIDQALRKSLRETEGTARVGLIASLGARRDPASVPALAELIFDLDARVASAALSALGTIGGPEALAALTHARERLEGPLLPVALDATLRVAEALIGKGEKRAARVLFEELLAPSEQASVRVAALRGLARLQPERAAQRLLQALRGPDGHLSRAAIQLVGELPGGLEIRPFAAELGRLETAQQVQLLAALARRRDPLALPEVRRAAESADDEVRTAALAALGVLGGAAEAELLARHAAGAKGALQKAAREALIALPAPVADERILAALSGAPVPLQLELLRALEARASAGAGEALLLAATHGEAQVRLAAIKALKVAGPETLPAILGLLRASPEGAEQAELVRTTVALAREAAGGADPAAPILAALEAESRPTGKQALLVVLGRLAGPASLAALKAALSAPDREIRSTGLKALSDWPDGAPLEDLRRLAVEELDPDLRLLALRGYVGLVARFAGDDETKAALLRQAMELAPGAVEKRLVLAGVGACFSLAALELAGSCLEEAELVAEAAVAVARLASKVFYRDYAKTRVLLERVLALAEAGGATEEATKTLERIEEFEDYLVDWQVAGPFALPGGGYEGLLEQPFPPEMDGAAAVEWKPLPSKIGPENPALIDLNAAFGGRDRVVYLRTWVHSDKAGPALLLLGSDDGIKVWLNGTQVFAKDVIRAVTRDQERVPVTLCQGRNLLLLKVAQGWGEWGFTARLRG